MPARNEFGNKTKKKKGRAPAHQNTFAYKHNPCSKKTDKILSLPNIHTCQRCYDKIEWRKQYRKYKPRTQPGTCNGCKKRNVKAAYHTICTKCTTESAKAKDLIKEVLLETPDSEDAPPMRACAVCVKEIALPDPEEEENDREHIDAMSRLNLRQRRALERKVAKEEAELEAKAKGKQDDEDDEKDNDKDRPEGGLDPLTEDGEDFLEDNDVYPDYGDDEEDPFLKAIGGADKLLTGEAYQRKLIEQQKEKQ